jgi:hypothetical protein
MFALAPVLAASLVLFAGVAVGLAFGIRALNRRVQRADAENAAASTVDDPFAGPYRASPQGAPGASASPELAPLYYLLSVFFWPAGFIIGGVLLRDSRTARVGRTCMLIAMGLVTAAFAMSCLGVTAGAVFSRRARARAVRVEPRPSSPLPLPTARPVPRSTSPDTVVLGRVGAPVVVGDLVVQVHSVEQNFVPSSTSSRDVGGRFVAFDVSFRNEGSRVVSAGSHSLKLFDADGFLATSQFVGAKKPALSYASVTPGNVVRGWVTFRLPTNARPGRLQITTSGGPPRVAEISLAE